MSGLRTPLRLAASGKRFMRPLAVINVVQRDSSLNKKMAPLSSSPLLQTSTPHRRWYATKADKKEHDEDGDEHVMSFVNDIDLESINVFREMRFSGSPPISSTALMMDRAAQGEVAIPSHFTKVSISMKGYDFTVLDSYVEFIRRVTTATNVKASGRIPLPSKIKKYTVLKGPHVHKQHRSQYEVRTHRRLIQLYDLTGATASDLLDYILRMVPPGVEIKLTHDTVEAPDEALAAALGITVEDPVKNLTIALEKALSPEQLQTLSGALNAYRHTKAVQTIVEAIPPTLPTELVEALTTFIDKHDINEYRARMDFTAYQGNVAPVSDNESKRPSQ
eukprot:m.260125 g.260125  ORF g.260125 m.260125 type:complete len:334 (-) comp39263_c0_seq1:185-1186(-)